MRRGDLARLPQLLKERHFDLVHVQTPFVAHYAGLKLARQRGIPCLTTYHTHFEEYFHHYLPLLPRPLARWLTRQLARSQCNALDAIVVPSHAMRATQAWSQPARLPTAPRKSLPAATRWFPVPARHRRR
jgi:hypothetical protein